MLDSDQQDFLDTQDTDMSDVPQPDTCIPPGDPSFWQTWSLLWLFWTVVLYVSLSFGTNDTILRYGSALLSWRGMVFVALLVLFCGVYHFVFLHRRWDWPMKGRRALFYFPVQLAVLWALTFFSPNFGWLGFAVLGHIASTLPLKQWPLPVLGVMALLGIPFDAYRDLQQGNWLAVLLMLFNISIFLGMFISVYVVFQQRFALAQLVEELRAAKHELEAQAAQTEELAALRERTRLARDMHDSIGHALVVVNVKLEAAQRLYAVDAARGSAELDATKTLVRDTMADLRRSLGDLRAPLPDHQDLPTALHHLAEDTRTRSHLQVTCTTTVDAAPLAPTTTEALWRVAREALANVERHAHATHATLSLARCDGSLVLCVADNGTGIDAHALQRPGHYGILGMHERAEALGGTLYVARQPDGGTMVEARVPVRSER